MVPEDERFVKVQGDGTVNSASPCIITNQCRLNIEHFPYDVQECNITLGSWMYDTPQIDLVIGAVAADETGDPDFRTVSSYYYLKLSYTQYTNIVTVSLIHQHIYCLHRIRRRNLFLSAIRNFSLIAIKRTLLS